MKKVLVLGASGMAGHVIALYLSENGYDVTAFSRSEWKFAKLIKGDVRNLPFLTDTITTIHYDIIINAVGILNQAAEDNKENAVFINSYLPHFLSALSNEANTRIIQMSTDCVFSGKTGGYGETSLRDGTTFYDRSKALGELENSKDLTFRNSIVGPDMHEEGIGLFNWFMKQEGTINGYRGVIWTGVTTLTLAKAMKAAIECNLTGLYNLVNNETISKYELLMLFNKHLRDETLIINPNDTVFSDKSLINNRRDFDFAVPSYEEMIVEMKEWIMSHKDLYRHY